LGHEDYEPGGIHQLTDARRFTMDNQGIWEIAQVDRVAIGIPRQLKISEALPRIYFFVVQVGKTFLIQPLITPKDLPEEFTVVVAYILISLCQLIQAIIQSF
jgi:hypothetical protein